MENGKAPHCGMIVLSFLEDFDYFIEELSVFQFPEDQIEVEDIVIKDILGFYEGKDVLVASRTKNIVQGL